MPKPETVNLIGIATQNSAYNYWLGIAQNADKLHKISMILYELDEMSSSWNNNPIEFSKESFLKNYDWNSYLSENVIPEEVFEYINWENGYIDDEVTHMQYWKDENGYLPGVWEYDTNDPNKATIVVELAVGGPNAHLLITYNLKEISSYPSVNAGLEKIEFQYHWWSPLYKIDLTTLPENANAEERLMYDAAQECLDQIHEIMCDNLNIN